MAATEFSAGRVALVTGAAGGLGQEVARRFAGVGVDVVLADVHDGVHSIAGELVGEFPERKIHAVVVNIADEDSVRAMADEVAGAFGRLDHLALTAGVGDVAGPVEKLEFSEWRRVFGVNLDGAFLVSKAFIPLLRADGGGTIVTVSSYWAHKVQADHASYCASKAGVIALTKVLAAELAPTVRVNAVLPGHIKTPMHLDYLQKVADETGVTFEAKRDQEWGGIPMRDACGPDEVADSILFLSSSASSIITGATLEVDGGISLV